MSQTKASWRGYSAKEWSKLRVQVAPDALEWLERDGPLDPVWKRLDDILQDAFDTYLITECPPNLGPPKEADTLNIRMLADTKQILSWWAKKKKVTMGHIVRALLKQARNDQQTATELH